MTGRATTAPRPRDAPLAVRDRGATEERILAAVGSVLARDGFGAVGVNAIAREAGVDKVLIYRYFGGLSELLRQWGASGRFWPGVDELLGDDPKALLALAPAERFARFFEHFVDALRERPMTVEILAAEIVQRNELTAILETERERWGERAEQLLGGAQWQAQPQLRGATLLWIAGVQYLLVRARTIRIFGGLDLHSDAGWDAIKASVRASVQALLPAPPGHGAREAGRRPPRRRADG